MKLTRNEIKKYFSDNDYRKGLDYARSGKVISQKETVSEEYTEIISRVVGSASYKTSLWFFPDGAISADCTCPRYESMGNCKHIAASMIHYVMKGERKTGFKTKQMLDTYLRRSLPTESSEQQARIIPALSDSSIYFTGGYPQISFRVGYDKPYVVKTLTTFLNAFEGVQTITYGKNLTLTHDLDRFDRRSQDMIRLLFDQMPEYRCLPQYRRSYNAFESRGISGNSLVLAGSAFDRFFDLYQDCEPGALDGMFTQLEIADPAVELTVQKKGTGIKLGLTTPEPCIFFGNQTYLYARTGKRILRCTPEFRDKVYPLFSVGNEEMFLSPEDIPTFCTCVLPEIRDLLPVSDPKNLLESYLPDDCTPCFYFDMEGNLLSLNLSFRYQDKEIPHSVPASATAQIRRSAVTEKAALVLAQRFFDGQETMYLTDLGRDPFDFLTEDLPLFRSAGEVYLSERLQRRKITAAPTAVGISLSDGMLTLDLDTGEFPRDELESLYQSLLRRKKYHRLADGRYLDLDGSGYEKMAEMAHMLQLSAKDLANGSVTVPAFRALYLDNMLSGSEGITVQRSRQFRQMIRDFKAIEDSDFTVPEDLEKTLRPYQKTGFQWLKTLESVHFGGILADEMGLGKTLQIITYLKSLDRTAAGNPSLIVCPASLILNWDDEFRKFAPDMMSIPVLGTVAQRKTLLAGAGKADVIITSYELLRQDIRQYAEMQFYCCVLDEAQHIKNKSTLISKAVKQLNCIQRFVLTGTPIENRLSELWNLFDFLMPGYLYSHNTFVERLEKPIIKSKNPEASAQLQKLVQPFLLRRLKKDVLKELPPKIEYVHPIPLSEEERKVYQASVNAAMNTLSDEDSKLKILAALTQLRQICCDPALCFENYAGQESKLQACLELCAGMVENGHQVLLFSQFTSMLEILKQKLDEMNISSYTLRGSTPKEKRAQLVKQFNAGGASVFLISLKAGGTGLNLTSADIVIHYDPWWNIAAQNQATDRAHRIGQQSCVQVYKLIAKGTIEEKILQLQEKKASLMELISQDTEKGILDLSTEDLMALMELS